MAGRPDFEIERTRDDDTRLPDDFEIERTRDDDTRLPDSYPDGYKPKPSDGMTMEQFTKSIGGSFNPDIPSGSGDGGAGGAGGGDEEQGGSSGNGSSGEDDEDDDDDGDDSGDNDPTPEPVVVDGCAKCPILLEEVKRLSLIVEAQGIVIANNWQNSPIPEDRLELFQLQETLKELQKKTKTELAYFQYIEGFAVYAKDVEGNRTIKVCFGSGETIGGMKKKIMETFGLPAVSTNQRKWMVLAGALTIKSDGTRIPPVVSLDKSFNRSRVKSYLGSTSSIEFGVRGSGGGKGIKKETKVALSKANIAESVKKLSKTVPPSQDLITRCGQKLQSLMALDTENYLSMTIAKMNVRDIDAIIEATEDFKQKMSESEFNKMLHIFFPEFKEITDAQKVMDDLKGSFQQLFLHFYILSYAGDKKFDHNQFIRDEVSFAADIRDTHESAYAGVRAAQKGGAYGPPRREEPVEGSEESAEGSEA
eukprot:symbB.v1.2.037763.t1/scaffold5665.1/size24771/1